MFLDPDVFRQQFDRFKGRVYSASGLPFVSFSEGLAAHWEGYKELLRREALRRLQVDLMPDSPPGEGLILGRLIAAIEISRSQNVEANNLVNWPNRYGHANRSHRALLDAREDPAVLRQIETWALNFFDNRVPLATAFDELRALAGARYDLLAYLFFLKDSSAFMPIAPVTFDRAFGELGIKHRTSQQCSWENYKIFNEILQEIRDYLVDLAGLADIRLVDAHSFCWLLVRSELDRPNATPGSLGSKKPTTVKVYDARSKSIVEMAYTVINTVKNSNGQLVLSLKKNKEALMNQFQLEKYIDSLLVKQDEKCALTGISLQYRGAHTDDQLLPSLDRIDSNGHYVEGNLQVVCRFINKWKSDTVNQEFCRLLALVRGDET